MTVSAIIHLYQTTTQSSVKESTNTSAQTKFADYTGNLFSEKPSIVQGMATSLWKVYSFYIDRSNYEKRKTKPCELDMQSVSHKAYWLTEEESIWRDNDNFVKGTSLDMCFSRHTSYTGTHRTSDEDTGSEDEQRDSTARKLSVGQAEIDSV